MLSQPCGSEARKACRTWRRPGPGAEAAAAQGPARPTQSRGGVSGEGAAADLARAPAHPQAGPQRLSGRDPGSLTAPLRGVRVASAPCPGSLSSACSGCVSCVMVTMTNPQQPREGQAACAGALLPAALRPAEGVPWRGGLALRPLVFAALSPACCPQAQKDECGETTRVSIHLAYSGCSDRKPSDQAPPEGTAPEVHNETV